MGAAVRPEAMSSHLMQRPWGGKARVEVRERGQGEAEADREFGVLEGQGLKRAVRQPAGGE